MRPVHFITQTARQISESDLSQRLRLNRDDELGELADTFDQMLDRVQAAFERQRQFTAMPATSCAPRWRSSSWRRTAPWSGRQAQWNMSKPCRLSRARTSG